jgi:hypothetical protein
MFYSGGLTIPNPRQPSRSTMAVWLALSQATARMLGYADIVKVRTLWLISSALVPVPFERSKSDAYLDTIEGSCMRVPECLNSHSSRRCYSFAKRSIRKSRHQHLDTHVSASSVRWCSAVPAFLVPLRSVNLAVSQANIPSYMTVRL